MSKLADKVVEQVKERIMDTLMERLTEPLTEKVSSMIVTRMVSAPSVERIARAIYNRFEFDMDDLESSITDRFLDEQCGSSGFEDKVIVQIMDNTYLMEEIEGKVVDSLEEQLDTARIVGKVVNKVDIDVREIEDAIISGLVDELND